MLYSMRGLLRFLQWQVASQTRHRCCFDEPIREALLNHQPRLYRLDLRPTYKTARCADLDPSTYKGMAFDLDCYVTLRHGSGNLPGLGWELVQEPNSHRNTQRHHTKQSLGHCTGLLGCIAMQQVGFQWSCDQLVAGPQATVRCELMLDTLWRRCWPGARKK